MFNTMHLDEVTLILDIGGDVANDSLSRWWSLAFINEHDHAVMTAHMTVRYDDLAEVCNAANVDAEEARVGAFVRMQGAHFSGEGRMATEVAWVKVRKALTFTMYHLADDQRAVIVFENATGIFAEVFESRGDAAHAFNAEVAKANRE